MPDEDTIRKGRLPFLIGGRRVNVYLDSASLQRALQLGNGNLSEGIRVALERSELIATDRELQGRV